MPENVAGDPQSTATTPLSTCSSDGSRSTNASGVSASGASSFPYLLQAKRSDTRLLHKKSQPLAFRRKQPPSSRHKPTEIRRTPSCYEPKVVEDSAVTENASSPALARLQMPPTSSYLTVTEFIKVVETPKPTRPPWASPRSVSPVGQLKRFTSASGSATTERRSPDRFGNRPTPPLFNRRTSFKTPTLKSLPKPSVSTPTLHDISPAKSPHRSPQRPPARRPHHPLSLHLPPRSPRSPAERQYHNVTPPEKDPSSPYRAHFNPGDHYFRTFGPEIDHIPTPAPASEWSTTPEENRDDAPPPLSSAGVVRFQTPKLPSEDDSPAAVKPLRSSIFHVFRKSLFIDGIARASSSTPKAPGIEVTPPIGHLTQGRKSMRASDIVTPPYFAQLPSRSTPSTSTPLTPLSPRYKFGDSPAASPRLLPQRMSSQKSSSDTSEPSPFTRPRTRPRLRQKITLEDVAEPYLPWLSSKRAETRASPRRQRDRPSTTYNSAEGEDMYHTAAGSDAVHWTLPGNATLLAPSEKRSRESFKERVSVFKRLLWRPQSSQISWRRSTSKSRESCGSKVEKKAMQHSASMGTLLRKASRPSISKLKKAASQSTVHSQGTVVSRPELQVTNFHQTPYAQRVANNHRNEMTLLRSYIEEALNDEDDNTVFGFELNVPDHLPNSPLCPLSPKHRSGGKAICPLHGRSKKKASTAVSKIPQKPALRPPQRITAKPQIVYESKEEDVSRKFSARSVPEGSARTARIMSPSTSEGPWYED